MAHAWLDSLSEDWPSQLGSDASPPAQLPSPRDTEDSGLPFTKGPASRIPLPIGKVNRAAEDPRDSSVNILNERSASVQNIPSSARKPSKLSQELKPNDGQRYVSQTFSTSTGGSVVHNTVQHKSWNSSQNKGHTPEWRRRLVHGDVAYGEQRDLFCSAAEGLENMFRPPPMAETNASQRHDATLPSSPPARFLEQPETPSYEDDEDEEQGSLARAHEGSPSPSPRKPRDMTYRVNDSCDASSLGDLSDPSHHFEGQGRDGTVGVTMPTGATSLLPPDDVSRKTSGQSVIRNEDFSPIVLSHRQGATGGMDYAPEMPVDQLKHRLEKLRINQMLLDSHAEGEIDFSDLRPDDEPEHPENTDEFAQQGGYLNLQRGGRSGEGSFRHRPLSPGMGVDTSEMLPEESLQASTPKQFPSVRVHDLSQQNFEPLGPPAQGAPQPSPEKAGTDSQVSGGSPLKLFGVYDTFTNQTLLRRISQFEDGSTDPSQLESAEASQVADSQQRGAATRSVSQFGKGDLEGYQFDEHLSFRYDSDVGQDEDADEQFSQSMSSNIGPQDGTVSPPDSQHEMHMRKSRQRSSASGHPKNTRVVSFSSVDDVRISPPTHANPDSFGTPKRETSPEAKRPMTSPSKDPTPKRRRTLHESDLDFVREPQSAAVESVQDTHFSMQSMMSRKRKDARPGAPVEPANPEILALRQVLRPRTPTPSQRSSIQRDRVPSWGTIPEDHPQRRSPKRGSQLAASANDRSYFTETDRKPSIKTQDFVDQAGAIMAMLRNGSKPPSGLSSVEESEGEKEGETPSLGDESFDESTKEPFSRPPSRDGAPVTHVPARQEDPKILDHLRKYQEMSDMGEIISSSLRSLGEARDLMQAVDMMSNDAGEHLNGSDDPYPSNLDGLLSDDIVSDPPNMRISNGPARQRDEDGDADDFPTHSSLGSTVPTGSSRGSESRRTIAPQSVSHLIPDQVGSMYLDRQQNIWIKRKEPTARSMNILPSEDSEDDPFGSIPDLSVDLTKELRALQLLNAQRRAGDEQPSDQSASDMSQTPSSQQSRSYVVLSPDAAIPNEISSRARDEIAKFGKKGESRASSDMENGNDNQTRDQPSKDDTPSRKNLTISFSSPIASVIHDMSVEDIESLEDDTGRFDQDPQSDPLASKYLSLSKAARKKLQSRARGVSRGASRQLSMRGQSFVPRPVSRIDEQDEESQDGRVDAESRQVSIIGDTSVAGPAPDKRQTSLNFVLSTPGARNEAGGAISQNVGNLSLTPLSEFTMHTQDQSFGLEVSYIVEDRHLVTGDGSKRVLSMAVRDLVDRLTEVEPFEPNWEDFQELDVSGKRLSSLHMLDEFCGRLVTLDASENALRHLDGIPTSVRQLKMTNNLLTELTSWDHLYNLQYIDVSNNELESLTALGGLVHLRSVKADNNRLTSLDGLKFHDGLLTLRARDNKIEALDFEDNKLDRLVELDLASNQIEDVSHLGRLKSLEVVKLQRNKLTAFNPETPLERLRHLDLSDNEIADLDISTMPALRLLHADRNKLSKITGFVRARHLDSVSLREQRCEERLDLSFLSAAYEVRKLFLSGNLLGDFEPKVDFLNLQLLELANCGLHRLPENMGQLMPNLRSLNLNFNAFGNVEAIRYIPRLKKLLMAGNRLSDSTHVTELLTEFPHLTRLDLRDNPMTLGFYASLQTMVPVDRTGYVDSFMLPEADKERDELYAGRLDEGTRLRRRLYQMVFVGCCQRLKVLDGLVVDRKKVLARDAFFDKLAGAGLFRNPSEAATREEAAPAEAAKEGDESSRWNAEDSFA
ncbi:leucine-rich repeat-containing protein [Plectosphaerella cucumerina]|uniref:Leucine-rich repeat-containing protein n=1 Tax=Plectosphaerella cucumerina TaxID=40658 RepID=A0A8K0TAB5_9PEZI|nr:leucine-rich repeat-containing protein [Plectosphaerella cucumerina]